VVINDRAVSMIHAWIDKRGDECVLTDTGSRTGTLVNGKRITRPLPLVDGDVITVGPATLTFQANGGAELREQATPTRAIAVEDPPPPATIPETSPIPPAAVPAPVAPPPPPAPPAPAAHAVESSADGWLFDCACGAPLWAGASFAGRTAYCRYCGREVRVPESAGTASSGEDVTAPTDATTVTLEPPRVGTDRLSELSAPSAGETTPEELPRSEEATAPPQTILSSELSEAITKALESSAGDIASNDALEEPPAPVSEEPALPEAAPAIAEETATPVPVLGMSEPTPLVTAMVTEISHPLPTPAAVAVAVPVIEPKHEPPPEPVSLPRRAEPRPSVSALSTAAASIGSAAPSVLATPPAPAPEKNAVAAARTRPAPPPAAKPKAAPLKATRTCGICQSGILFNEKTTTCPSCGLTFHDDCWVENRGCSAYGCPQVGILDAKKPEAMEAGGEGEDDDAAVAAEAAAVEREAAKSYAVKAPMPWEHITLAASAVCVIVSAFTFGVPSFVVGAGTMYYLSKKPGVRRKTGVLLLSTMIALVGFIVGLMVSWFLYFDRNAAGGGHRP
jgi:pSer/pThr/pTyr-binding forkhead associated (FHA) protein